MEIVAEVEPTRSREKLEKWIPPLRGVVDWIDIPESPLGVARAHSVAVAHYIEANYGIPSIAHLRTMDLNMTGLKSLVGAAVLLGLRRLVLLRGDPPSEGDYCSSGVEPEEGVEEARRHALGRVEIGLLVSARRSDEEIKRRLSAGPDFAMILNASRERLADIARLAARLDVRVYAYLLVETRRNKWITARLPSHTPRYTPEEAVAEAHRISSLVDGLVLSVPGDYEGMALVAERLKSTL
jgi:5,10-methylenetetrahydrofolate reductase